MAPQVISLLSSPEPERLALPAEPPKPTSTSLRALQQKWDFSSLEEFESVERIPESSAPFRQNTVARPVREDFFFDSDDFDVTGDIGGGKDGDDDGMFLDDGPSKRRRLSEDSLDLPVVARPAKRVTSVAPRASALPSSPPRATNAGVARDPIELSSSPVRPTRAPVQSTRRVADDIISSPLEAAPRTTTNPPKVSRTGGRSDFRHPFLSSSPPPARPPPKPRTSAAPASVSHLSRERSTDASRVEVDTSKIPTLMRLGFTDAQVRKALRLSSNDLAKAIEWLCDHKDEIDDSVTTGGAQPERHAQPKPKPTPPKRSVGWDPISSSGPVSHAGFSSPPARKPRLFHRPRSEIISVDDTDDENIKPLGATAKPFVFEDTDDENGKPRIGTTTGPFAFEDSDNASKPSPVQPRSRSRAFKYDDMDATDLSNDDEFPGDITKLATSRKFTRTVSAPTASSSRTRTTTSAGVATTRPRTAAPQQTSVEAARAKLAREADRERTKLEREAEKERKKQEKEQAKEEKKLEKVRAAALAEANKVRTDKKVSTPEMIVDLPDSLPTKVKAEVEVFLKDIEVEYHYICSPVDNAVKWRRKVRARYNDRLSLWEPIPIVIEPEKHAMVILPAEEFVALILAKNNPGSETQTLDRHVTKMKRSFQNHTYIYLIEGLDKWSRENKMLRNRQFRSAVTGKMTSNESTTARKKKNPAPPKEYIDEDLIEDALLTLQVRHKVLIHHTRAAIETAKQIAIFTQQLSTLPYKKIKEDINAASANFCMESGQVKTGDGVRDTYAKMLQEVNRITAPIAYGIIGEFGSLPELVRGLEEGGPNCLEDVRKCADAEGTVTSDARRIGPSVSKRVWGIFTGREEESTNV